MTADDSGRRRVLYSGHVQGVGFRYTTRGIAQGYAVTGFVRNLSDGRVELVAEGNPAIVEAFLNEVARALARNIDSAEARDAAGDRPVEKVRNRLAGKDLWRRLQPIATAAGGQVQWGQIRPEPTA